MVLHQRRGLLEALGQARTPVQNLVQVIGDLGGRRVRCDHAGTRPRGRAHHVFLIRQVALRDRNRVLHIGLNFVGGATQ